MNSGMNVIVVIPSRMGSSRLPGKAMADILGEPMVVHVWRRGIEAALGPVVVACGDERIAQAIQKKGGMAVLTDPDLPSGSDRVCAALDQIDPERKFDIVINLQGDMPTVTPDALQALLTPFANAEVEMTTLATVMESGEALHSESVVSVCAALDNEARSGRCLYFSRNVIPWGSGPHWHHVGLYAYRRATLHKFAASPVGQLEMRERLEQLRALETGIRLDVSIVDIEPLGVDTPADLDRARHLMEEWQSHRNAL